MIPEKIRDRLGFTTGQEFVVVGNRDGVILKSVKPPSLKDFNILISRARQQARRYGLKKKDVVAAIARVRGRR